MTQAANSHGTPAVVARRLGKARKGFHDVRGPTAQVAEKGSQFSYQLQPVAHRSALSLMLAAHFSSVP
jgi:hypothetical protein